jgi:hypothetical protein
MDWRQKFTPIERRLIELSKYDKPETITFASKYELYGTYTTPVKTESYFAYMESFTMNPKADGKIFWSTVQCNPVNYAPIADYLTNCIKFVRESQLLDKKSVLVVEQDIFLSK